MGMLMRTYLPFAWSAGPKTWTSRRLASARGIEGGDANVPAAPMWGLALLRQRSRPWQATFTVPVMEPPYVRSCFVTCYREGRHTSPYMGELTSEPSNRGPRLAPRARQSSVYTGDTFPLREEPLAALVGR